MEPNDRNPIFNRDFILGFLLGIILHVAFTLLWFLLAWILSLTVPFFQAGYNFILLGIPIFFFSITQVIYLLPAAYIVLVKKNKPEIGKGLIGCAILTVLLNGSCFVGISNLPGLLIVIGSTAVLAIVSWLIAHKFTN
jgi:hypothetical protein